MSIPVAKLTPNMISRITELQESEQLLTYIEVIDELEEIFLDEGKFVDGADVVPGGYSRYLFLLRTFRDMKNDFKILNNIDHKEV